MGLSAALVAALMVIAFLLGRESNRSPAPEAGLSAPPPSEQEAVAPPAAQRRWPAWADLDEWDDVEDLGLGAEPVGERIERRPNGTLLLSNRGSATDVRPVTRDAPPASTGSTVSDYFSSVDMIRSEAGAGDPNTFAMGLIKAGMGGSTAGFDQLITDAKRMEDEIRQLTPPPACTEYHQANLNALAESRVILEEMKSAFAKRDFSRLTATAQEAGTLQHKARELQRMRQRIAADASR